MNFLKEYISYASELTDADKAFHEAVGLGIMAAACGNNFFFQFGDQKLYPNCFILILGDSSTTRKTTCLTIGKNLLCYARPEALFPDEGSYEKYLQVISKQSTGVLCFSEFLSLLSLLQRDYNTPLKSFLTGIYDAPEIYRRQTLGGENVEIKDAAISILACSTLSWFQQPLNESDIEGGFIPRFLIVLGQRSDTLKPMPPPVDQIRKAELIKELKRLASIRGAATMSREARQKHDLWYHKYAASLDGWKYGAFRARLQAYLIKVAMLIELAQSRQLIISGEAMTEAVTFIDKREADLKRLQGEELTFTKSQRTIKLIKQYLTGRGRVPRSQLLTSTRLSARELNEAIQTLVESEQVTVSKDKQSRKGTNCYELTT